MANASDPIPALKPPPGVKSNFQNPDSLTYRSNWAIGICIPFVTIFFLTRSYVRIWIKRTWIFEDCLAFTAWAGTVAYCGIMAATMAHNGGKHAWDITATQAHQANHWFNIASIEYGIMVCITKLAVLWLYRRIFSTSRYSMFDISIVSLIVILILFYGSTSFVKIFECTPRAKISDRTIPGHCVNVSMLLNTSGLFNTITDFIILLLPVKAVWTMSMKKRKKVLVVLVFTFGLCAPIFSLVGFIVRLKVSNNPDTTWNQPEILLWGAAELATGNLCVCFPEMGALLKKREGKGPSASIVNGKYRNTRPRKHPVLGTQDSLMMSNAQMTGKDPYIELKDGDMYGVSVSRARNTPPVVETNDVRVTNEVTVESHVV